MIVSSELNQVIALANFFSSAASGLKTTNLEIERRKGRERERERDQAEKYRQTQNHAVMKIEEDSNNI